ncbi:MAG: hypothetical protein MI919_16125, partial [Holophagales bacterium]|nr:hypothetical protein [Holophagales bacterium]
ALAALGAGAFLMDRGSDSGTGDDELVEKVAKIERLEQEAVSAASAASKASETAVLEAEEAGSDARAASRAAVGGSCSLANNHAKGSGSHAVESRRAAVVAAAEAMKAEQAAQEASAVADGLGAEQAADSGIGPLGVVLRATAGIAHADDAVRTETNLRERGVEASGRAGEAAENGRFASNTADAAANDAETAAGNARAAAASCGVPARSQVRPQPPPPLPDRGTKPVPPPGPLPSFGKLPETPVVAVLSVGDPLMAGPVEATLEKRLLRGGFDVRDELNSLELASLLESRGASVSMSEILPILAREGFHVAVLVKVEEGARRRIETHGQYLSATAARLRLNAQLLPARRSIGRGWTEPVEYTELSAEAKGKQAFIGATAELVPAIRDGWTKLRGGG